MWKDRCQQLCKNDQYEQAFPVCSKAAEQGDAAAQCNLGLMYDRGEGVQRDDAEAVKWYRKAAEQGYAKAQCNLGWMYGCGLGVRQDYAEAVKWVRKAAEQGHAEAEYWLGFIYEDGGIGVQQDYAEAVKWYRKAAEQSYAEAEYNLAMMYANGDGVLRSRAVAADWYYKAGLSYLKKGKKNDALMCVEQIKCLKIMRYQNAPNAFLADKLLTAIYGGKESRK
jgi:TPR repeat protein